MDSFELIVKEIIESSYTHSEIIALTACLEETIPSGLSFENHWLIEGLLKGLRKHGINHNTRLNIAKIILRIVERDKRDKEDKKGVIAVFGSYDQF